MWHLCGVIIEIQLSDPQLNFGSILEIHFLFIYEIPIYRTWNLVKVSFFECSGLWSLEQTSSAFDRAILSSKEPWNQNDDGQSDVR